MVATNWKHILPKVSGLIGQYRNLAVLLLYIVSTNSYAQESAVSNTQLSNLLESSAKSNVISRAEFESNFAAIYKAELSPLRACEQQAMDEVKVCSSVLRNEGNAPYALFADAPKATVVLFHGLSDSPFFMRSIAEHLHQKGFNVIAPLTPGHGKLDADADMQDPDLLQRWYAHVDEVMTLANKSHEKVFVGGFSTGGAFATHYTLKKPDDVEGLLLFSGALELSSSAETLSKIWGIKTLAVWLDGEYETDGPNPYKYPKVATYSALVLMDIIKEIRTLLDVQEPNASSTPIFAAHSLADTTTMYSGIENLLTQVKGEHTRFKIDKEFDVCHADLVLNSTQIITMKFDKSRVNPSERCAVPKANPLHGVMLSVLGSFVQ